MVYGRGIHINETGKHISEYPTLPADTDIVNFMNGCFICQPTVFLKISLLNDVGYLNEELQTAFDYELWLRAFKKHKNKIGFINKVSAYSRLHSECKTLSMRKQVALEAMQILNKHLGSAPRHWLLTYFDEMFEHYPHIDKPENLPLEIKELYNISKNYLDEDEYMQLGKTLTNDARFTLLQPDACINIYSDGWLSPLGCLRVRASSVSWKKIELACVNAPPNLTKNVITIMTPWGDNICTDIQKPGEFRIEINLPHNYKKPSYWSFFIKSEYFFIPHDISANNDHRKLSFQIKNIYLVD